MFLLDLALLRIFKSQSEGPHCLWKQTEVMEVIFLCKMKSYPFTLIACCDFMLLTGKHCNYLARKLAFPLSRKDRASLGGLF